MSAVASRPGYIPAQPFRVVLNRLIGHREDSIAFLARRCNLSPDSLYTVLERPEIEFDLADLILCRLGQPMLWHDELEDIYMSVELPDATCARLGCGRPLPPKRKRYCSQPCQESRESVAG